MDKIFLLIGLITIITALIIAFYLLRSNRKMQQRLLELSNQEDNSSVKADITPVKQDKENRALQNLPANCPKRSGEQKKSAVNPAIIDLNNTDNMTEMKIKTVIETSNKGVNRIDPNRFQVDKPDNTQTLDIVIGEQLISESLKGEERAL